MIASKTKTEIKTTYDYICSYFVIDSVIKLANRSIVGKKNSVGISCALLTKLKQAIANTADKGSLKV